MTAGNITCSWPLIIGLIVVLPFIVPSTRGYLFAFIFHLIIKLNSERATAVIKQVKDVGDGWWEKGDFDLGHMLAQLVNVTLEVHPQNGTPYSAQDRFSANADVYYHKLKPGAEMQVAISRLNPAWVAALPKTITPNPRGEDLDEEQAERSKNHKIHSIRNPKGQLEQLQQMLTAGLITQQDYEKKKDEILAKM